MQYTVTINEKSKTVTVNLNGYEGVAKCCATDTFNLQTGIELALERARVAEANAKKPVVKPMGVMELVKALEKALPEGQAIVVGNGKGLTTSQKAWLHSLTDCEGDYDEGYADGYADAQDEYEECEDCEKYSDAMVRIVAILDEVGAID